MQLTGWGTWVRPVSCGMAAVREKAAEAKMMNWKEDSISTIRSENSGIFSKQWQGTGVIDPFCKILKDDMRSLVPSCFF